MRRSTMCRAAAVALFGLYFGLWLFGWLGLERSDAPQMSRELFYGLVIGVPCFLVGAAVARWWAPAVGLFFVAFLPVADRCVQSRDYDLVTTTCSGVDGADLALLLSITTPCVIAGVAAIKLGRAAVGRWGGGPPAASSATEPHAAARAS